ncbi:MAG TPA: hypothetical protein DC042_07945 [Bacteroidales bacterium]|nr:hypothetical protein [Bacteroidales bacterium]
MKEEIKDSLENPKKLEELFRNNKGTFKKSFDLLYPDIKENLTAQIWNERLNFENKDISWGTKKELIVILALSVIAGLIAKIPDFTALDQEFFYLRNIAFIFLPMLMFYFAWKQSMPIKKQLIISAVIAVSALYMNLLPVNGKSDTLMLACIHLPLFMWALWGYTFTGDQFKIHQRRTDFLRFNGELVVMTTVMLIAGAILSAVTIGLFELINLKIEEFYFRNIAVWGLAASPILGTYIVLSNPQLVKNVSPVIAKVFTPLVLVMLVVYLIAIVITGKDPYNDREFLLIFNLLLIGVMAIILFSVAETSKTGGNKTGTLLLFMLSIVTIIVNGIALSAIIFRITEWGITPNRLAVLGGNLLILINLMMVTYQIFKSLKNVNELVSVENSIASFLPVYTVWTVVVTFIFPVLFGFK